MLQDNPNFETHATRQQILIKEWQKAIVQSEHQKAHQKWAFDKHAEVPKFSIGQQVLVLDHNNENRKLETKFEGPDTLIKVNENYAILQLGRGKPIKHNILNLKPYFAALD